MQCPECNSLACRRNRLWRLYSRAVLDAAYRSSYANPQRYIELRAVVDDARIDLKLAEAEFRQHRAKHAVPN
jgi:hypothetical protein